MKFNCPSLALVMVSKVCLMGVIKNRCIQFVRDTYLNSLVVMGSSTHVVRYSKARLWQHKHVRKVPRVVRWGDSKQPKTDPKISKPSILAKVAARVLSDDTEAPKLYDPR